MRKVIILIFVMFLIALASADDSQLSVNVSNAVPSVDSIVISPGVQIIIGAVTVKINATIEELNGIGQIDYVKAYVTGPSTIEESPITLVKVADINGVSAIYNGNFSMSESDNLGEYNVNVSVYDLINLSWMNVSFNYVNPPNNIITVCSLGCNFTDIQSAVDAASNGYTVYVYDGFYSYFSVSGKSGLKIIGESLNVKIAGDNANSNIVFDNVNNSELINFTVYDGWQGAFVKGSNNNNFTNIVSYGNNNHGFVLINDSDENRLNDVEAYDNTINGIYLIDSSENSIINSKTYNNGWHGVSVVDCPGLYVNDLETYNHNQNATWSSGLYLEGSDVSNINNLRARDNGKGLYIYYSDGITVDNSNLSNNNQGIRIHGSDNNILNNNILYNNNHGIYYTYLKQYDSDIRTENSHRNIICDVNFAGTGCEYDYTAPAKVVLSGVSGSANKKIVLNWTDVGENWEYGTADSYVLKYSNSSINNSNWDSAIIYDTTLWTPSVNGTAVTKTVTMPDYGIYYFAMKVEDDSSNLGDISNSIAVLSPEYNISVDSIECVNGKNGYACNYALSGSTNYLYDVFNISGNITNSGNLDVTKTVRARRWRSSWSTIDSKDQLLPYGLTTYVDDLFYNISDLHDGNYFSVGLFVDSSSKQIQNARVWSIADHTATKWWSPTAYPASTESANTPFYVAFNMTNNNSEINPYYGYPFEIEINTNFTVLLTAGGSDYTCEDSDTKCYYDLPRGTNFKGQYFYWYIDGLPIGTYEINVKAGVHPNDSPAVLTKTLVVVE